MTKAAIVLSAIMGLIAGSASAGTPAIFPPAAPTPTDPQTLQLYQEVAAADAGAGHAIYTKNYSALNQYWAPEFIVNGPGNRVLSRAQVIEAIASGKLEYHDYHNVVEKIAAIGDNVIEMGHEDYIPSSGPEVGKTIYRRYTQFLVRRAGRLVFIARQATIYDPSAIHY